MIDAKSVKPYPQNLVFSSKTSFLILKYNCYSGLQETNSNKRPCWSCQLRSAPLHLRQDLCLQGEAFQQHSNCRLPLQEQVLVRDEHELSGFLHGQHRQRGSRRPAHEEHVLPQLVTAAGHLQAQNFHLLSLS